MTTTQLPRQRGVGRRVAVAAVVLVSGLVVVVVLSGVAGNAFGGTALASSAPEHVDAQNLAWALATADAHHYSEASQDLAYIGDELASRMDDRLMIGSTAGAGTGVEVAVGYDGTEPAQLGAYFGFGDPVRFHRVEVRLDEVVVHDDVYRLDGSVWSEYERMDEGPFLGPYGLEDVSITGGVSALTAEFRYVDDGIEILCIERGHYPRGAASKFGYAPDWVEVSTCEAR